VTNIVNGLGWGVQGGVVGNLRRGKGRREKMGDVT